MMKAEKEAFSMNRIERNRQVAEENERLLERGTYEAGGRTFFFSPLSRLQEARCYPAEELDRLAEEMKRAGTCRQGRISVVEGDTMEYAGAGVLNFANAFTPGGGYLYGASSQEEALCRESTLYTSLAGPMAAPFYEENRRARSIYGSESMVFSPRVEIFRRNVQKDYAPFGPPKTTSVITAAAIDLRGPAAEKPATLIRAIMKKRILRLLSLFAATGCHSITLGAWGCGVFLHNPQDVAREFHEILVERNFRRHFDHITFAIYGSRENFEAFEHQFCSGAAQHKI